MKIIECIQSSSSHRLRALPGIHKREILANFICASFHPTIDLERCLSGLMGTNHQMTALISICTSTQFVIEDLI